MDAASNFGKIFEYKRLASQNFYDYDIAEVAPNDAVYNYVMSLPSWERNQMMTKLYFIRFDIPDGNETFWAIKAAKMAPATYRENVYHSIMTQKEE